MNLLQSHEHVYVTKYKHPYSLVLQDLGLFLNYPHVIWNQALKAQFSRTSVKLPVSVGVHLMIPPGSLYPRERNHR